ncbi:MAG: hypothetical protein G01um10143_168 [Parcubacteria group bacterium Gr01-1014_3]|nr:MAG: hypothetical protein G01um10143_168 [Parcubacteria group bacterium Gr01-1014_3]
MRPSILERVRNLVSTWWGLLIVCFVLFFILLFPMLSGSKVLSADASELMIPQLTFFKDAFAKGESPFWNPYIAVGFPNFISNLSSPFAPVVQLARFLSPIAAHYWYLWFALSLTLFFSVRFLRELGIGTWGSLIGGLSYIIGDFYWSQNATVINILLVQAVLFLVIMMILKSSGWQKFVLYAGIGSLAVAWGWLTTVVYFGNLYIFTTLLAFVVFLGIKHGKIVFYRLIAALAASFLIGSLIGALQLVPVYIMAQFSGRSAGLAYQVAQGYAIGFKELLNFVHLTPQRGLEAYLYLGIAPLMLLIFSFFSKNPIAKFFRWFFLIALAISIKGSPLFWLIIKLPLFSYFQGSARFMFVGAFAGSVLVGFGCEYVLGGAIIKKRLTAITIGMASLMILTILVFRTQTVFYSVLISAVFLTLVYLIFKLSVKKLLLLLPLLTILTVLDMAMFFYSFNKSFVIDRRLYEMKPATLDFFKGQPGRVLPLFVDDWDDTFFYQFRPGDTPPKEDLLYNLSLDLPTYRPNYSLLYGIETLEINDPLLNVEMGRLLAFLGTRQLVTDGGEKKLDKTYVVKDGRDISVIEKHRLLASRLPLADFLGIRYFMSPFAFDQLDPKITLPLVGRWFLDLAIGNEEAASLPISTYLNPNARPLAYFADVTAFKSDPMEIYEFHPELSSRLESLP